MRLTDRTLASMMPDPQRRAIYDDGKNAVPGFHFVPSTTRPGTGVFWVKVWVDGRQRRIKIGGYPAVKLKLARQKARKIAAAAGDGALPEPAKARRPCAAETAADTFGKVKERFIDRYARRNNKTWKETERLFDTYVTPVWGKRALTEIRRRDVNLLLDQIEDSTLEVNGRLLGGPTTADRVLAAIRKLFNWYATTDDDFVSPVVKGMSRTKPSERARTRILSDDEIRALWTSTGIPGAAGGLEPYCAVVRTLLLTAQRRTKVSLMRRSDITDGVPVPTAEGREVTLDGVWDATADDDGDNKQAGIVPLPQSLRSLIARQPIIGADEPDHEDYLFTFDGKRPINGWRRCASALRRRAETLRPSCCQAGNTMICDAPLRR